MTNTKKMTKRMKFEALLALDEVQSNPTLVEFIEHEIELLDKKNSAERKPTGKQIANEDVKGKIIELAKAEPNKLFTVTDFLKALGDPEFTNQKISALVRQLYDRTGEDVYNEQFALVRIEEKRKAYFQLNPNFEG